MTCSTKDTYNLTQAEVFDAEAEAALQGLKAALQLQQATPYPGSSQATSHAFQDTIKAWKERPRKTFPNWGQIMIHWFPRARGHPRKRNSRP